MLDWLRRSREKPAPLSGAPAVRRLKTYSAASGYVYQYFYEGQRSGEREGDSGTEYVFSVSADRKTYASVSVFVSASAAQEWEQAHSHALAAQEVYAVSKMALFQAFDEREKPELLADAIRVRYADLDLILEILGID